MWFLSPRAQEEREDQREFAQGLGVAGERPERHAPWPAAMELAGARGQGARGHANAWDLAEKNAGKVGGLTSTTETARTTRFFELRVEVAGGVLRCGCCEHQGEG